MWRVCGDGQFRIPQDTFKMIRDTLFIVSAMDIQLDKHRFLPYTIGCFCQSFGLNS